LLYLDSAKARSHLHWQPVWRVDATMAKTADWYRAWLETGQIIVDRKSRALARMVKSRGGDS